MTKTALEVIVAQHTKDIDHISSGMDKMLDAINGLRSDMAKNGSQMIGMLNTQNIMLLKNYTDHEALDITRFAEIKTKMAYYVGYGMGGCAVLSILVMGLDMYLRSH